MDSNFYIFSVCAAIYGITAVFIGVRARQTPNVVLALCCAITSLWAAISTKATSPMLGIAGSADMARLIAWYGYLVYLYVRTGIAPKKQVYAFVTIGSCAAIASVNISLVADAQSSIGLFSIPIVARLLLSVSELLLIENMYLNLPENHRWHVVIPCVLLGGIACFDILVAADTALIHSSASAFLSARCVLLTVIAPFLVLAAFRGQRWSEPVRLSRTAVFHSATLVLSGSVLVILAGTGELVRRVDDEIGWIVELSLISSGVLGLALFLSSRSARSAIQRVIVNHFYAARYDYRVQWLQCISTLSGIGMIERTTLATRSIRTIADVVDSPSGSLFLQDSSSGAMNWSGSWNTPASKALQSGHPWVMTAQKTKVTTDVSDLVLPTSPEHDALPSTWLIVPLLHNARVIGIVTVGPPRLPFRLDQEVIDLLRIVGREVGTYIAEQQAVEAMIQTQQLHDYSKRFAFVAHDIKNVASQLALLVNNAEHHLSNPDFQLDMVKTVQSSVQKIDLLIKRLNHAPDEPMVLRFEPSKRLSALVDLCKQSRKASVQLETDGKSAHVTVDAEVFDTIVTHLLNNAVESGPDATVVVGITHRPKIVVVSITDTGRGMSADFIRDELFVPFKTNKVGGSGIGAYQARELLREIGGELHVSSTVGSGTTVSITLPRSDAPQADPSVEDQQRLALTEERYV